MTGTYTAFKPKGFETRKRTETDAKKVAWLVAKVDPELTARLLNCCDGVPCNSGACPRGVRRFRLQLLKYGLQIIESGGPPAIDDPSKNTPYWTAASIITRGLTAPVGRLAELKILAVLKRVSKALERSAFSNSHVIGGIDISINSTDNASLFWQVHLYLLISGKPVPLLKRAIRDTFPPEPSAVRPYRCTTVYSPRGALTYCVKNIFTHRSTYHWQGKRRVKDIPLSDSQMQELLLFLDQGNAGSRLILGGLRRNGKKLEVSK